MPRSFAIGCGGIVGTLLGLGGLALAFVGGAGLWWLAAVGFKPLSHMIMALPKPLDSGVGLFLFVFCLIIAIRTFGLVWWVFGSFVVRISGHRETFLERVFLGIALSNMMQRIKDEAD